MRYRLLHKQTRLGSNNISVHEGSYKPVGQVQIADSSEEALRDYHPVPGRWLVLCEDEHTWRIFNVVARQEVDLEPLDMDPSDISSAMV